MKTEKTKPLIREILEAVPKPLTIRGRLVDPHFPYVPAANTDIRKTFARLGWVPPSEKRHGRD